MTPENPSQRQIERRRPKNETRKNKQLDQKTRMNREFGVARPQPAGYSHNSRAQRNLRKGPQDVQGSHRAISQAENNEKCEEIKKTRKSRRQCGPPVLHPLKEKLQKYNVQNYVHDHGYESHNHRRFRIPR